MRYYDLSVTPAPTKAIPNPPVVRHWTSIRNGVNDPGALDIQFDLLVSNFATPMGASTISIAGIPLQDILQAVEFSKMNIALRAGMSAGLPLVDPKQAGLVMEGTIGQSWGNWVGTDMALNFLVWPSLYTYKQAGNFIVNWKAGDNLAAALEQTLKIAYPDLQQQIEISNSYVWGHDTLATYSTLRDLAIFVNKNTGGKVEITIPVNNTIRVYDNTVASTAKTLRFNDLIGQPTWIEQNKIQIWTVLRADIQVGNRIRMPEGLQVAPGTVQTTAAALPSGIKYKTAFQGEFIVYAIRQIGNMRDPNGASWATVLNCVVAK